MRWALASTLVFGVLSVRCSSSKECQPRVVETEIECETTAECVEAGYKSLECVNGTCGRTCRADGDCSVVARLSDKEKQSCPELALGTAPTFICENQTCKSGCPHVPCGAGETCVAGRCEVFFDGFEERPGVPFLLLSTIGWNGVPHELGNDRLKIVFSGLPGCARGEDKCAGPPSEGTRFAIVERRPTPAVSTPITTTTCRACACCRECMLAPPASTLELASCPGSVEIPATATCPATVPAVCGNVCAACESCQNPVRPPAVGGNLLACEMQAAQKICSACQGSACDEADRCERDTPMSADCVRLRTLCDAQREACTACESARRCDLETPGSSECARLHGICDGQGADGCFPTPMDRPRSVLSDLEQSLVSPAIDLSVAAGELVLELDYVPFNVGEQYRRVVQGANPATWPVEPQLLVIELCGHDCEQATSWVPAKLLGGASLTLPRSGERRNGVRMGAQSSIDWTAGRLLLEIPSELKTSQFRFRFLPQLADDVRVGIDAVRVRRLSR